MKESDINATMTVKYVSEGEGQVASAANTVVGAQDKVAASANALATAVESSAKRQASAAAALDALARRSDPAARALAELEKTYKDVTRALSFDQSPVAIDKANKALDFYRERLVAAEAQQKLFFGTMSGNTIDKALKVGGSSPAGSARESADAFLADVGGLQSVAQAKAAQIGQAFGVSLNESMIAGVAKSARDSASVFTADLDRLDSIAQAKAMQVGQQFSTSLNENMIAGVSKSAKESASVFSAEFDRIDTIAQQKAMQAGQAFGASLSESLIAGVAKSAKDSASVFSAEMDRLDAIAQQKAMQIGKNFQDDLNQSFNIGGGSKSARDSGAVFEEAAKAQDMMAASATRLRTAINPLEAEQGKLGVETAQYRDLLKQNIITQDEFNAHQVITSKRLGDFAQNLKTAGTAGRVMSSELANMSFQLNDVVTDLALGQSPFMIIAQQGGQVFQILQQSKASLGEFAKTAASSFMEFFTAGRVAFGGVVTAIGAAIYANASYIASQREVSQALIGIGGRTQTTAAQINDFAKQNASATGLSVDQARNVAIEFTKTGTIAVAGIKGVGEAVHGFSILTGQSAEDSSKAFAKAFSGNIVSGAEELNKTYGFLNASVRDNIRALELQGDRSGAMQVIINAIAKDNLKAAESTSLWAKAYDTLANAASKAKNAIGAGTAPTSLEDQLAALEKQKAALEAPKQGRFTDPVNLITGLFSGNVVPPGLNNVNKAIDELKPKIAAFKADNLVKELDAVSLAGDNVVRSAIPEIAKIEDLQAALQRLNAAQNEPGVTPGITAGPQQEAARVAINNQLVALRESQAEAERYNLEVKNISSSWGNVGQSVALQLQSMQNALPVAQAWTESGKMKAQYEATYLDLLNKAKTAQEATAIASKQEELSRAAAVASAQKMVQASEDNLDKIKAEGTGMEGVVASSIAYRDAMQAGATQTQAAAIAANTLQANLLQAAKAADKLAQSAQDAQIAAAKAAGGGAFTTATGTFGDFSGAQKSTPTNTATSTNAPLGVLAAFEAEKQRIAYAKENNIPGTYGPSPVEVAALAPLGYDLSKILGPQFTITDPNLPASDAKTLADEQKNRQDLLSTAITTSVPAGLTGDNASLYKADQVAIATLQGMPQNDAIKLQIAALTDQMQKLTDSTGNLTNSTDGLNNTMGDLLSPYYNQDPRTSHIGFRSQGMASGGEFTVPGGYSSNDNMVGQIPLASGEVVSVHRPGEESGGATQVVIHQNITIQGNANKDEVGRTMYQNAQNLGRQLRASA